nr:immunoglobulin light chain junction region [Macaca mulatta]
CQHYYSTPLSF